MAGITKDAAAPADLRLQQLLAGLTAARAGDFSTRLPSAADPLMDEIATVFNAMTDQLALVTSEVTRVAREVGTEGKLGGQAEVRGLAGTWRDLTDSVNSMAGNLTGQVRDVARVATAVAKGDLSQKITVDVKGEMVELKETINTMVDELSAFADEVTRVAREVGTEGRLGGQARVPGVGGTWRDLTDSVNSMADNLTSQVRNIAQVTTAVARGDLSRKIDVDARGEILELKTTINTMVDQLSSFAAEVTRVAREVGRDGRLGGQAEVEGVSGTWKRLTENVNELAGNLTRQVRAIAEVTSAVATGDLTRSISVEAQGEVAELKDNINAMVLSLRETTKANQEQDWLQTSLARIAGLIQGHRDLATVAELIMTELIPMVGAQHGTFFLAETSGQEASLRLIAGYGLRADVNEPSQFRLGQSLIGQVAKTKRPIVVTEVPAGYVRISSGLGEAPPANLIVLPIVFEDQVLGVIEAGSFSRFTQVQQDFLTQLMETIGVSVNTIIASSRTDALLSESQRLAAELQARTGELQTGQEELRRSNAELAEQAAQLARQNRDIESKNAEIELARQEIEERAKQIDLASRYKSQFLANMSHELRTPLNSLLILARLLAQNAEGNLTPKQVEYAHVIHSSGTDLLQLINDILDLSRVEAGKLEIHPERFALEALVDDLRAVFGPLTTDKGLDFAIDVGPGAPAELFTDNQRLRQILHNLLSNAVKFTDRGGVELRIGLGGAAGSGLAGRGAAGSGLAGRGAAGSGLAGRGAAGSGLAGRGAAGSGLAERGAAGSGPAEHEERGLAFSVSDTGIGVSADNLETIFGAFQQGDGTTSRRYGGTGLGLAICRELAAQLGGLITARSAPGRGSTFTLLLPLTYSHTDGAAMPGPVREPAGGDGPADLAAPAGQRAGPGPAVPGTHDGLYGKKVLIVDDDLRNAFAITSILELYGLTVIHASDGRKGIETLQAAGDIDIVLMDVMMPELDGYATTGAIREIPGLADLPVIAVTARAMPGDRDKSITAGASDYVTKPVDTEELLTCMERWLGTGGR